MIAGRCAIAGMSWGALRGDVDTVRYDLVENWTQEKTGGDDEADAWFDLAPDETQGAGVGEVGEGYGEGGFGAETADGDGSAW